MEIIPGIVQPGLHASRGINRLPSADVNKTDAEPTFESSEKYAGSPAEKIALLPDHGIRRASPDTLPVDTIERLLYPDIPVKWKSALIKHLQATPLSLLRALEMGGVRFQIFDTGMDTPLPCRIEDYPLEQFKRDLPRFISLYHAAEGHSSRDIKLPKGRREIDASQEGEDFSVTYSTSMQDGHSIGELDKRGKDRLISSGCMTGIIQESWDRPMTLEQIARSHGASHEDEIQEYVSLLKSANSRLLLPSTFPEQFELAAGQALFSPEFHYFQGRRIPSNSGNSPYTLIKTFGKGEKGHFSYGCMTLMKIDHSDMPERTIVISDRALETDGIDRWVVFHEIGHALWEVFKDRDPSFFDSLSSSISGLYESKSRDASPKNFLTVYSQASEQEFFAEAFAAFNNKSGKEVVPSDSTTRPLNTLEKQWLKTTKQTLKEKDRKLYRLVKRSSKRTEYLTDAQDRRD